MEDRTQQSFMFPVGILRLRLPHTKPLSLTTTLAGFVVKFDNLPEAAKNAAGDPLELLSQRRTNLVNSLLSSVPEQGIKAIEEYLPGLVGLSDALRPLPPLQDVRITWSSALGTRCYDSLFSTTHLQIELLFVLTCYGLLHRAAAAHILAGTDDANFDANAKLMASQLRIAAGIFEFIATCQAPNTTGLLQERIPEKVPQTYTALSLLCLAEAQQITVKKAMLAKTSPSLVAKLMVDCRNRYAGVAAALRSISEGDGSSPTLQVEFLQPVLVHYVSVNRILIESLMYKYLGVLAFAAQEHGRAVGFLRAAVSTATSLESPSNSAKSGPNGAAVGEMYAQLSKNVVEMKTLLSIYEKENFSVFFDAVPSTPEQLQVPTEGKSIVKAEPFSIRDSWSVSLLPTAGDKCCVM